MPLPQPLSHRLIRLGERLAAHQPVMGTDDPSLIWAAVSVVLAPSPDALLLIRRAERSGDPWSGHMALPGGRREPGDGSLLETAIRETVEELALRLDPSQLLGALDDVIPRTPVLPPVAVRPFVFCLPRRPSLVPNEEVAAAAWVPLDHLLNPATYHTARIDVRGASREMPAYRFEDTIVWGMTERILTGLLGQLGP
jgi:8-oxo-dGTP pyrophosphatase MutT (NUDIX family)